MSAGATPIDVPAERGGATAGDRPEDGSLLHAQPGMLLEEGVTLRMEDIGHLHGRPAHDCRLPEQPGPGQYHGRRDLQLLERIRCRLEMPSREVQIHRRVREIGMAEQQLNRSQVGTCFEQMRGVGMPQRVRCDALVDAALARGEAHGVPDHLRGDRRIGSPAVMRAGEQIRPRPHPAVVLTQRREQRTD